MTVRKVVCWLLLLLLAVVVVVVAVPSPNIGRDPSKQSRTPVVEEVLREELKDAIETGHVGDNSKYVAQKVGLPSLMLGSGLGTGQELSPRKNWFMCTMCGGMVDQLLHELRNGTDPQNIVEMIIDACITFGLGNDVVCSNFIHLAESQILWIAQNTPSLTGRDVCGMVLSGQGCTTNNPDRVWEVTLPDTPKPPLTLPTLPEPGSPVMKVLHLADTHFDPHYLPGSNADCAERYHCCRAESGPVNNMTSDGAGYWGDYRNCDAPKWLLEAIYKNINNEYPDLDFIIWTGDLVPHNIWNTSRESNLQTIRDSVNMVKTYFPGVPVFPAVGNHESNPVNAFPQPYIEGEFDISWLYDEINSLWETWLPPEAATSVTYSGFYSILIKPGLRLLSINTNYCYSFNWWLLFDDIDPASELDWMANELQQAEDKGEKVYVIGHHPPGHDDCAHAWSHQYNKIVHRYESTIAGLFYGHTHKDHFMMFYDPNDPTRAAHVGYVAQSQTPYHQLNPGYKVYTVDGDYEGSSFRVLDHANYIIDLDVANANPNTEPRFFLLYNAKEEYGLPDLTPASWSELVYKMNETGSHLFDKFFKNYIKNARPYMLEGCDQKCKAKLLCRIVVSDTSDTSICDSFS